MLLLPGGRTATPYSCYSPYQCFILLFFTVSLDDEGEDGKEVALPLLLLFLLVTIINDALITIITVQVVEYIMLL